MRFKISTQMFAKPWTSPGE